MYYYSNNIIGKIWVSSHWKGSTVMNLTTLMMIGENITSDSPISDRAIVGIQVVGIGMGVVFGVLILLIGILQIFKLFGNKKPAEAKPAAPAAVPAPVATPAPAAATPVANTSCTEELLVAVATSAIAASRGQSEVDFNVISIAPIGQAAKSVNVAPAPAPVAAPAPAAAPAPVTAPAAAPAPAVTSAAAPADGVKITAPLPGTVLKVVATAGAAVKKGDVLCVLEAMKMENDIVAPQDGTVASVSASQGASVNTGDLLFVIG